jgi:hypothetical protein
VTGGASPADVTRHEEVQTSSNRSFGLVLGGAFIVLPLVFWWRRGGVLAPWPFAVAAIFLLLAAVRPAVLAPLNRLWTRFGLLLAKVTNPLMMAFIFFVVVTPVALVMRIFGKRPLRLGFEPAVRSYWIERRPPGPAPDTMTNQF